MFSVYCTRILLAHAPPEGEEVAEAAHAPPVAPLSLGQEEFYYPRFFESLGNALFPR